MFTVSAKSISFEWLSAGPCVAIRQGHGGRNAVVAAIAEGQFFPVVVRRSHASRSAKAKVDGMPLSPREAGAISSKWWSAGPCVAIGKGNGCRKAVVTVAGARHSLSMAARLSMSPLAGRQGKSNVAAAVIVREGSQARLATWRHSRSAVCVVVFVVRISFVCQPSAGSAGCFSLRRSIPRFACTCGSGAGWVHLGAQVGVFRVVPLVWCRLVARVGIVRGVAPLRICMFLLRYFAYFGRHGRRERRVIQSSCVLAMCALQGGMLSLAAILRRMHRIPSNLRS